MRHHIVSVSEQRLSLFVYRSGLLYAMSTIRHARNTYVTRLELVSTERNMGSERSLFALVRRTSLSLTDV